MEFLKKMLVTIDNQLKKKQISENNFSFGIKEYIEIPGIEYQRDIGIMGFDVTVVFKRTGRRVRLKKMKRGKIPKRQTITKEEIIKFMEDKFQTEFIWKNDSKWLEKNTKTIRIKTRSKGKVLETL